MDVLSDIKKSFGDQNDDIDDDILDDIFEEIDTIDPKYYYSIGSYAIRSGKPQILTYLLSIYNFSPSQREEFYASVQKFREEQLKKHKKAADKEYIHEIANEFIACLSDTRTIRRKTSFKNH
jgi:hypothetical protein